MTGTWCRCCGRSMRPGERIGRVDLRLRDSEFRAVRGVPARRSASEALVTATVCEQCAARIADGLRDAYGLERRSCGRPE